MRIPTLGVDLKTKLASSTCPDWLTDDGHDGRPWEVAVHLMRTATVIGSIGSGPGPGHRLYASVSAGVWPVEDGGGDGS
jgi:hypothetical protein